MNEHLAAFVGYLTDKEKSKSTIESNGVQGATSSIKKQVV